MKTTKDIIEFRMQVMRMAIEIYRSQSSINYTPTGQLNVAHQPKAVLTIYRELITEVTDGISI